MVHLGVLMIHGRVVLGIDCLAARTAPLPGFVDLSLGIKYTIVDHWQRGYVSCILSCIGIRSETDYDTTT